MLETGRNIRLVKKLNLSNTWGDRATRLTMMGNWWALLPRSSWHMLQLYTIVLSSTTKHDSCKLVCNKNSLIDSVHTWNSCPLEMNGLLFQFTVVSVFFLFIPLLICWVFFGCTFCLLVLKWWQPVSVFLLSSCPTIPPKSKRLMNLKFLSLIILTELNSQCDCNFRLKQNVQTSICKKIFGVTAIIGWNLIFRQVFVERFSVADLLIQVLFLCICAVKMIGLTS